MAAQARVSSVETIETFRGDLIVFLERARMQIDAVAAEVRRTKLWVQNDQRLRWEGETRRRKRQLDQAEQELLSARLSSLRDNLTGQMNAVRKAKQAVEEGETKLRNIRRWTRDYDSLIEPRLRNLESLRGVLDHGLPMAIAFLRETRNILESYAETQRPSNRAPTAPPAESGEAPAP